MNYLNVDMNVFALFPVLHTSVIKTHEAVSVILNVYVLKCQAMPWKVMSFLQFFINVEMSSDVTSGYFYFVWDIGTCASWTWKINAVPECINAFPLPSTATYGALWVQGWCSCNGHDTEIHEKFFLSYHACFCTRSVHINLIRQWRTCCLGNHWERVTVVKIDFTLYAEVASFPFSFTLHLVMSLITRPEVWTVQTGVKGHNKCAFST